MRKHLYERHADEWISGCDRLGIPITAKDDQPAVEKFRQRYGQQSGTGGTTSGAKGRRPFSHEAFVDALVELIVGDDQFINVIENKHLRNLFLMLREDLRDSDIPHRSIIRNPIMELLDEHLDQIEADIAVCNPSKLYVMTYPLQTMRRQSGRCRRPWIYGQIKGSDPSWQLPAIGLKPQSSKLPRVPDTHSSFAPL
ncbi:hypothetical protein B0H19DRAFT_1317438 [Mycena capillaripes]|nr:hypothetical protein B0H19DRAFT_1317438 [Mycena capillaripes]